MPTIEPLPDQLVALRRLAPRPLGLYMMWLNSVHLTARAKALATADGAVMQAVEAHAAEELRRFLAGVAAYRHSPYQRPAPDYKIVAESGRAKLLDCGGYGTPVVLVPSLVNKGYILDLLPDISLVNSLLAAGHQVLLVDWGAPTADPATQLTVDGAVELLQTLLARAAELAGEVPIGLGYCMGGTLLAAAAALQPSLVQAAVFVATPWDFSHCPGVQMARQAMPLLEKITWPGGLVPVDVLQGLFMLLEPTGAIDRLQAFGETTDAGHLRRMTVLEDWLTDGVPLEAAIATSCMVDWYGANKPLQNQWQVLGQTVTLKSISCPTLTVIAERDTLVPAASSAALAAALPESTTLNVPAGHIGLMAGRKAVSHFHQPLCDWLSLTA